MGKPSFRGNVYCVQGFTVRKWHEFSYLRHLKRIVLLPLVLNTHMCVLRKHLRKLPSGLPSGLGFPDGLDNKKYACNAGDPGLILGLERSWRREWQPTSIFLPGESHGQRSLAGYSPWGHKELDMTEHAYSLTVLFYCLWKYSLMAKIYIYYSCCCC